MGGDASQAGRAGTIQTLAVLALASLALRPELLGIGPLAPAIEGALNASHSVTGLLTTVPVLCMGVFAPLSTGVYRHLGDRWGMVACLAGIGVFAVWRASAGDAAGLLIPTLGMGVAMGVAGVLLPASVKAFLPHRPLAGTMVYTLGLQGGSVAAPLLAIPIATMTGGWRSSLLLLALPAFFAALVWMLLMPAPLPAAQSAAPVSGAGAPQGVWRLAGAFALFAGVYFGLAAWLPSAYVERGWSPEAGAGLLTLVNLASLAGTLALPLIHMLPVSRRALLPWGAVAYAGGVSGLWLLPTFAVPIAVATGVANGVMFPLLLALPLDAGATPAEVAALSGVMLGAGFSLAAIVPVLLGWTRDMTGSFAPSLALLSIAGIALAALVIRPEADV